MDRDQFSKRVEHCSALWFNVPRVTIVGIEHPYLISDIERAIDSLGGLQKTSKLIRGASASIEADLHLHPGNPDSKPIASFNTKTSNVLLRITVPKRTGRKRKRGSNGEFSESSQASPSKRPLLSDPDDAQRLFRSIRDNADRYRTEIVGSVKQTHRFRRLPDFVWSTENSPFMAKFREHILPFECSYRRQPGVKQSFTSAGLPAVYDERIAQRNKIFMLTFDAPSVPTAPSADLPSESTLAPPLRNLIAAVREIFVHRPICTRRVVQNRVPADIWKAVGSNTAKHVWQYVGFIWASGPWRDTICAFGVDPRKNKEMRWFQTVIFQFEPEPRETRDKTTVTKTKTDRELAAKAEVRDGHLFDGRTVRLDGRVWQMCDITDPLLKNLIDTELLRDECDIPSDGWYTNGTWAKIKVIMKAKIAAILAGETDDAQLENELLRLHQKVPDVLTDQSRGEAIFERGTVPGRMVKWAESVRTTATRPGGKNSAWGPETAKRKTGAVRASGVKKQVVSGRARGRGGRPRKQRGDARNDKLEYRNDEGDGQEMIDPRLRDITGDLEDVEREAAMRAFEDDIENSDEEGSEGEGSTIEGSDDEGSDTEDSDVGDSDTGESDASGGRERGSGG
ncbi:MAG: hypothetical protein Q9225_002491 [Loekoesia sp. 1 TL-2023]